jgi:hypothetical protein
MPVARNGGRADMLEDKLEKRVVLGCGIFETELTQVLKNQTRYDVELVWLKSGLHTRTDLLAATLAGELESRGLLDNPELRILFGASCLLDLDENLKSRLKFLPTDNCLTAMLGRPRLRELEEGRTMVVTASWIRKIYLEPDLGLPLWDPADMRMNLGRYDRILILDTGLESFSDEEILNAYDLMGVVLEFEPCSLDYFQNLIMGFLA